MGIDFFFSDVLRRARSCKLVLLWDRGGERTFHVVGTLPSIDFEIVKMEQGNVTNCKRFENDRNTFFVENFYEHVGHSCARKLQITTCVSQRKFLKHVHCVHVHLFMEGCRILNPCDNVLAVSGPLPNSQEVDEHREASEYCSGPRSS